MATTNFQMHSRFCDIANDFYRSREAMFDKWYYYDYIDIKTSLNSKHIGDMADYYADLADDFYDLIKQGKGNDKAA